MFRFAIMGAGNIAHTFADAVRLIPGVTIAAVASKSAEKAECFAAEYGIQGAFDDYTHMLETVRPDAVYIATLPESHYALTRLCLERAVPVLCEKAMFTCSDDAEAAFALCRENHTFAMEGMWSRFLPVQQRAREWLLAGRIGVPKELQITIGTVYDPVKQAGFLSKEHGGGAANHLLVYGVELATWYFGCDFRRTTVTVESDDQGVDVAEQVTLQYDDKLASLYASCRAAVEERLVISGTEGRLVMEHPHFTGEASLYDASGICLEHYVDTATKNGFVYEIQEVVTCVQKGFIESNVMPWKDTVQCAKVLDLVRK